MKHCVKDFKFTYTTYGDFQSCIFEFTKGIQIRLCILKNLYSNIYICNKSTKSTVRISKKWVEM